MHLKFMIAVLSLFVVLNLTKTKSISTSTKNIYLETSESSSKASNNEPTSTDSDDKNEPEIPVEDEIENFNKTGGEPDELDEFKLILPYLPYIILAVVILGLVYMVKIVLDFIKFCVKFHNKLPKCSSKEEQTSESKEIETEL